MNDIPVFTSMPEPFPLYFLPLLLGVVAEFSCPDREKTLHPTEWSPNRNFATFHCRSLFLKLGGYNRFHVKSKHKDQKQLPCELSSPISKHFNYRQMSQKKAAFLRGQERAVSVKNMCPMHFHEIASPAGAGQ